MRKILALILSLVMIVGIMPGASAATYVDGTYTATARGFGGNIEVTIVVSGDTIESVTIVGDSETAGIGSNAIEQLPSAIQAAGSADVDGIAGATVSSDAIKAAAADALAAARGETIETAAIAFAPGTYEGTARGYNADITVAVTFAESTIESIELVSHSETFQVGTPAFDIMIPEIIAYTSTGVDAVAGATFTSNALLAAVNDAALKAGCDVKALQVGAMPYVLTPGEKIVDTYDVVVVGAGGAGMAAAAAAAQDGSTVLVIEKQAAMGGNTLVAGGALQVVRPDLVWDSENPDATTGIYEVTGEQVTKIHSDVGRLGVLEMILGWNEAPFDGTVEDPSAIVSIDDYDLPSRGVHAEFLPTLLTLKDQIRAYKAYADEKMAAGATEKDLINFDSVEMHIFQTYYGGIRMNNDKTEWIYSNYDLVNQMCREGYDAKAWYISMGAAFDNSTLTTLIGCMWQRINAAASFLKEDGTVYERVNRNDSTGKWGGYFLVPQKITLDANEHNQVMLRTTATELIADETGRVVGVKAVQYDGTEVEIAATKGVVLATGGYGANIDMVIETNEYWNKDDLKASIGTTNRSFAQGDGLVMAEAVGAELIGMGWTQLMPIGWADNGNLAGGNGEDVIFISPAGTENAGKRYVNESAERDVLSQAAYDFGGEGGLFIQLMNATGQDASKNAEGREYFCSLAEAAALLEIDEAILEKTITEYDAFLIGVGDEPQPTKTAYRNLIGVCDKDDQGNYLPDTYRIDTLSVRYLAPSTHHTMGGLKVDTDRRVLTAQDQPIAGLYAAGEVTGGFFAGNRLGGNATTEIMTAGRIAGVSASQQK